jgi:hypothetical protein
LGVQRTSVRLRHVDQPEVQPASDPSLRPSTTSRTRTGTTKLTRSHPRRRKAQTHQRHRPILRHNRKHRRRTRRRHHEHGPHHPRLPTTNRQTPNQPRMGRPNHRTRQKRHRPTFRGRLEQGRIKGRKPLGLVALLAHKKGIIKTH